MEYKIDKSNKLAPKGEPGRPKATKDKIKARIKAIKKARQVGTGQALLF